jgi:hypothetical protein
MTTMMDRAFDAPRTWLGLADASEAHLTPAHSAPAFGPIVEG